jgi:hypothetical protein
VEFSRWLDGYRDAFTKLDAELAGELFSDRAMYYESPYAQPIEGRSNIVAYWRMVAEVMTDVEFGFDVLAARNTWALRGFTTHSRGSLLAAGSGTTGSSSVALTWRCNARSSGSGGWRSPSRLRQILRVWQLDRRARPGAPYHASMAYEKDPRVDKYIDGLPAWQRAICLEVREIAHEADPDVVETIKRTIQPYFVLEGNICALLATKDHVNVFLYDPTVSDPSRIITAGHGNATGRQIAIYEGEAIDRPALLAMFRQIIANNRAGGWRKITR